MSVVRPARLAVCLAAAYPWFAVAADNTENERKTAEVVEVKATRQPYRSLSATGATKTETDLKDLPQAARVLTADVLRDAGVTRLADALDMGSSVARQNNFGGVGQVEHRGRYRGSPYAAVVPPKKCSK